MTALWITPVAEQMPGGYHGYWTRDLYRVDPHLGDLATLQELVRRAHALGLKVVLDVVLNHLGQRHPWLSDGAHAGWFHDDCPINFADLRSVEVCWLAGLPDLDTENAAVRSYLIDWSLWLIGQTGADGFRVDAARHLSKDFLRAWSAAIRARQPAFWLLGEVYSSGYRYQSGFLDAGLDAVTDFQTYDVVRTGLSEPGNLAQLVLPPSLAATDLGAGREDARATFLDNHDVPRFVGPDPPSARTLARLEQGLVYLFTVPGTPIVYYGTEIALPGGADPDDRRSMPWAERSATTDAVRALAGLRGGHASLRRGELVPLVERAQEVAYVRRLGAERILVAMSGDPLAARTISVPLAALGVTGEAKAGVVFGSVTDLFTRDGSFRVTLPPRGAGVWLLNEAPPPRSLPPEAVVALVALALAAGALGVYALRRRLS